MADGEYVTQQFCFERNEKMQSHIHDVETSLNKSIAELGTSLDKRMTALETHFNDALDRKIKEKMFREKIIVTILAALSGTAATFLLKIILP